MIFFTSDLHLGHSNIIKYCNRPFKDIYDMDETIITNWNSKINKEDTVYVLGDFCFKNHQLYLPRLNGHINLIQGDHDNYKSNRFLLNTVIEKQPITLCHWCLRVWAKSHYNAWSLFGHSHGRLPPIGKSWDVGVDNNKFFPLSFEDIKKIMENQPNNINFIGKKI